MFNRTSLSVTLWLLFALASPLSSTASDRHVVARSHLDDVGRAFSQNGQVNIALREIRANMNEPDGKLVPLRIFILFEPQSGAFAWTVTDDVSANDWSMQTKWFKSDRAISLKDGGMVLFTAQATPLQLYIEDSSGHASSMDDAEKQVLSNTAEFNDPPRDELSSRPLSYVPLTGLIVDFVFGPESAVSGPAPKVVDLQWDGKHWIVDLQARWIEEIILDPDYKLVSMKRFK
jgi:hypothetical protein